MPAGFRGFAMNEQLEIERMVGEGCPNEPKFEAEERGPAPERFGPSPLLGAFAAWRALIMGRMA